MVTCAQNAKVVRSDIQRVKAAIAAGERVMIYTSWTRTDSQQKLVKLLTGEGFRTEILSPAISPEKREAWVEKRVRSGCQILITNPRCVETGRASVRTPYFV